jgi:hypothetical protein
LPPKAPYLPLVKKDVLSTRLEGEPAAVVHGADPCLGLEIGVLHSRDLVGSLGAHLAAGEPRVDVAAVDVALVQNVAPGVERRGGGQHSLLRVNNRRQNLIGDLDGSNGFCCNASRFGCHQGNGIPMRAHPVRAQHGLIWHMNAKGILARDVGGG